jgi:uncharacterized protein (DUF4415 family)
VTFEDPADRGEKSRSGIRFVNACFLSFTPNEAAIAFVLFQPVQRPSARGSNMKKEYDLKKLRVKRRGAVIRKDAKVLKTIRIDADLLSWLAAEAEQRGIGYQTLLNMLLRERMKETVQPLRDEIRKIVREELQREA